MQFKANTRKFKDFWIFELACGPDPENSKITNLFAKTCRFLQTYADFCEKFADFCENLHFLAKICRFLRKFDIFCENLSIFAKI